MKPHHLRIIAGAFKGRKLCVATSEGLRPTTDRVRETLFNWLLPTIVDSECLDLFAGSGALGIEALSRGAKHLDFVEANKKVYKTLQNNLSFVEASRVQSHLQDAKSFLKQNKKCFDLIFFDPPFKLIEAKELLELSLKHLKPTGLVYVESASNELSTHPALTAEKTLQTKALFCGLFKKIPH